MYRDRGRCSNSVASAGRELGSCVLGSHSFVPACSSTLSAHSVDTAAAAFAVTSSTCTFILGSNVIPRHFVLSPTISYSVLRMAKVVAPSSLSPFSRIRRFRLFLRLFCGVTLQGRCCSNRSGRFLEFIVWMSRLRHVIDRILLMATSLSLHSLSCTAPTINHCTQVPR